MLRKSCWREKERRRWGREREKKAKDKEKKRKKDPIGAYCHELCLNLCLVVWGIRWNEGFCSQTTEWRREVSWYPYVGIYIKKMQDTYFMENSECYTRSQGEKIMLIWECLSNRASIEFQFKWKDSAYFKWIDEERNGMKKTPCITISSWISDCLCKNCPKHWENKQKSVIKLPKAECNHLHQ